MFYPHGFGKYQQTSMFASIKEHIIFQVQKNYEYGADIAVSIRDGKKFDMEEVEPIRLISQASDPETKRMEQTGMDIMYQERVKKHLDCETALNTNLKKAYALISVRIAPRSSRTGSNHIRIMSQKSVMIR